MTVAPSELLTTQKTPLQELSDQVFLEHDVRVWLKRDDLLHPRLPGNKFRKLKYNLAEARAIGQTTILTFGGAYSNHIFATAAAGQLFGFRTIGIIRGEEHLPLNPVLAAAVNSGMELHYLDRETYRRKDGDAVTARLKRQFGDFYLLPEGGSNSLALRGCAEIIAEIDQPFDYICCPVGTGGTLAGLVAGLSGGSAALGFAVLKGATFLEKDVSRLLREAGVTKTADWRIELDYHFGGFARVTPELRSFIERFNTTHEAELDPIYTGKMMYGLMDLVGRSAFPSGTKLVVLHTGGVPSSHWAELMQK